MKKFNFYNNITGWVVFLISAVGYLLTIEPTVSFWDCGEFIASAYKLEVGHPPGAPLFMIIARVFSLFAFGDVTLVAKMINILSALASAFTVLFLFWSITHIARKLVVKIYNNNNEQQEFTMPQLIAILASGAVGALAYSFSDTAWFSAVEAEVYALSSFFTAIVFWAILKWENDADKKYANRWLVLIAYLMGLSIGVHLLNLLAIPAIVLVYYFRKYKPSPLGVISALALSVALLGGIMYGIISGAVIAASKFELLFVNSFGFAYNTGFVIYIILLSLGLAAGIYYTQKYNKPLANTIILCFTVILIGYSSYSMTVIRSLANPPMDENNPDNIFSLLSYLNREQYGDRPLISGQYYNAPIIAQEPNYTYIKENGKYKKITTTNPKYIYDPKFQTIFPRMYSSSDAHKSAYKSWAQIMTPDSEKPSFSDNLEFFFKYQLGHMYFRYFLWNFAGRQNDEQGHGGYVRGNWISGFKVLDEIRLGQQDELPQSMKNKGTNKYYMLPFLLGILGLFFVLNFNQKDFWVIFSLFILTGIAIVIYLNQTPYQPRERDYAYAGSFYAFSIYIGLAVLALFDWIKKIINPKTGVIIVTVFTLGVPVLMAAQNWDDHDRSGRYTARDLAVNYLNSCAPNAILFTYGDNDTFPLWYAQEVEGIRTDVRVVNLSLLGTDWYINQMRKKAYDSEGVKMSLAPESYIQGKRDYVAIYDNPEFLLDEKYQANKAQYEEKYQNLYENFLAAVSKSKFPELQKNDYNYLQKGHKNMSPIKFSILVRNLLQKQNAQKYSIDTAMLSGIKAKSDSLLVSIASNHADLRDVMKFAALEEDYAKLSAGTLDEMNFIPTNKFLIQVDKDKVLASNTVKKEDASKIVSTIKWKLNKNYILKSDLAVLDIIAQNNWERPIYFSTSIGEENYFGLEDYFQLEGFANRLLPIKNTDKENGIGRIDTDIMYELLMNKFTWGRMFEPDVLIDHHVLRVISLMDIRTTYARLAVQLIDKKENEKAVAILDKCMAITPHEQVPYDHTVLPIIEGYYRANQIEKANALVQKMATIYSDDLNYYAKLSPELLQGVNRDQQVAIMILGELIGIAQNYKQDEVASNITKLYMMYGGKTE